MARKAGSFSSLQILLDAMAAQIPSVASEVGQDVLNESLLDADYFVTVDRLAWSGEPGRIRLESTIPFQQTKRTAALRLSSTRVLPTLAFSFSNASGIIDPPG